MARHIGMVIGSAEGGAQCYRTICSGAADLMGDHVHPEISIHNYPFNRYIELGRDDDWDSVAGLLLSSARKLESIGADFIISPDNTLHRAYDTVVESSPLPWIHIAAPVRDKAVEKGLKKLAILGTRSLMESTVYSGYLSPAGIDTVIPDEQDRILIDRIIINELVYGMCTPESRKYFESVIHSMKDIGCDGVVLACSEVPLLLESSETGITVLDTIRLLAEAAVLEALREN